MPDMPDYRDVSAAITNMVLTTYGNTIDWPTAVAALNLSIFDIKVASQDGFPDPTAAPSGQSFSAPSAQSFSAPTAGPATVTPHPPIVTPARVEPDKRP